MLTEALLIALWAGIAGFDSGNVQIQINRPIFTGLVVGLILGDVQTGLMVGGTLELIWIGAVALAGAIPPDVVMGGVIGVSLAIIGDLEVGVAVGLCMPFALVLQALNTLLHTVFSPIMHIFDKMAEDTNIKGIDRLLLFVKPVVTVIMYFGITFLCIYFGAEKATALVSIFPVWATHGLSVAGTLMPAVGFAMLLKIMWKQKYTPFFLMGFVFAAYLKLDVLAISILATGVAIYDFNTFGHTNSNDSQSLEEDYSDGI